MKEMMKRITAVCMTFVILSVTPLNDISQKAISQPRTARAAESDGKYISEVRIGMGETDEEAKKELEEGGYTILKDESGNYADLNEGAGSKSIFKKGANDKKVYLGYKTTSDPKEAITDLAAINMGVDDNSRPYSTEDYNVLMKKAMDSQIKPFVERFIATLNEYRENYNMPKNTFNHIRADYTRQMLNKLNDDDTGKPVGDLLLNETKYEMGDTAYNALSDEEKKNHADILTMIMQANGQATLAMETLLSKATDTSDDTWIDRFTATTLEDLEDRIKEENTNIASQTDLNAALDKKYQDTAKNLLDKWETFRDEITDYEDTADILEDTTKDIEEKVAKIESLDPDNMSMEEEAKVAKVTDEVTDHLYDERAVKVGTYLDTLSYEDGTLRDFFSRDYEDVKTASGLRSLYPIVDALTPGQIAGLEFLSFADLVMLAMSDEEMYGSIQECLDAVETTSIYDGVDREIYEEGGVAMTSNALRTTAASSEPVGFSPSKATTLLYVATFSIVGFTAIALKASFFRNSAGALRYEFSAPVGRLAIGISVLAVIVMGFTVFLTIKDIQDYYKTKYVPIPNIMVDKADITKNDKNGDEIVIKNQSVYYRAVRCNRTEGNTDIERDNYKAMADKADLNGDIGRQWFALYAVKYEYGTPILADSLLYKKGDSKLPNGYETGIHEFNSFKDKSTSPACDLNKKSYLFADDAPSIYVYYKTETQSVHDMTGSKTGSIFSPNSLALGAGVGAILGALFMWLFMRKKRIVKE